MLGPFWKKHFAFRQFYPIHGNPSIFITCQWQRDKNRPNLIYLAYRASVTLLFFITWILSIVDRRTSKKWPIFLTNWGYTLCTLQSVLALFMLASVIVSSTMRNLPSLAHYSMRIYPVYWIINTIATSSAFGITLIYWLILYDNKVMVFDTINYFVHGNNSLIMMMDLWMVSHPTRILHFIYPATFAIVYTIFSAIYYSAGGTAMGGSKCIYKIVDWDSPFTTLATCLGVVLFLICLHIFVCVIAKARMTLDEKCCRKEQDVSSSTGTKRPASYVNEGMSNDIV